MQSIKFKSFRKHLSLFLLTYVLFVINISADTLPDFTSIVDKNIGAVVIVNAKKIVTDNIKINLITKHIEFYMNNENEKIRIISK